MWKTNHKNFIERFFIKLRNSLFQYSWKLHDADLHTTTLSCLVQRPVQRSLTRCVSENFIGLINSCLCYVMSVYSRDWKTFLAWESKNVSLLAWHWRDQSIIRVEPRSKLCILSAPGSSVYKFLSTRTGLALKHERWRCVCTPTSISFSYALKALPRLLMRTIPLASSRFEYWH